MFRQRYIDWAEAKLGMEFSDGAQGGGTRTYRWHTGLRRAGNESPAKLYANGCNRLRSRDQCFGEPSERGSFPLQDTAVFAAPPLAAC